MSFIKDDLKKRSITIYSTQNWTSQPHEIDDIFLEFSFQNDVLIINRLVKQNGISLWRK